MIASILVLEAPVLTATQYRAVRISYCQPDPAQTNRTYQNYRSSRLSSLEVLSAVALMFRARGQPFAGVSQADRMLQGSQTKTVMNRELAVQGQPTKEESSWSKLS